jgi:hypothetical protein
MKGWRFSWRAALGWVAGALVAGAFVGLALDVANIILSPEDKDEFLLDGAVLVLGCAVIFLVFSGLPILISSIAWRLLNWWPRPWFESIVGGGALFALLHAPGVNIGFDFSGTAGAVATTSFVAFCVYAAPVIAGVLGPLVYWLVAKPQRT